MVDGEFVERETGQMQCFDQFFKVQSYTKSGLLDQKHVYV